MAKNNVINVIIVLYVFSALFFTPLAVIIKLGVIVYLVTQKQWRLLLILVTVITIFMIISFILTRVENNPNNVKFTVLHTSAVISSSIWLVYSLLKQRTSLIKMIDVSKVNNYMDNKLISAASNLYLIIAVYTFSYLMYDCFHSINFWNWIIFIPCSLFLALIWPIYWSILHWITFPYF